MKYEEKFMKNLCSKTILCFISLFISSNCWALDPCEEYIKKLGYEPKVWRDIKYAKNILKNPRSNFRMLSSSGWAPFDHRQYEIYLTKFDLFIENSKQYDCGLSVINEVILESPDDQEIIEPLVRLRAKYNSKTGNYEKAKLSYEEILKRNQKIPVGSPRKLYPYYEFSWFLSTCPASRFRDGKRALELAKEAIMLTPKNAPIHSQLSAAASSFAELSEFKEAANYQKKAIKDLKKWDPKKDKLFSYYIERRELKIERWIDLQVQYQRHLESYRKNEPWREKAIK
jgi:tetratricopeptide (TPR) repeat protein